MPLAAFRRSRAPRGLLLACAFVAFASATRLALAQPLDPGFDPNANADVFGIAAQPDGKIIAAGNFTALGNTPRSRIARLNLDGTIDSSFNPVGFTSARALAVQPDGRILVGGSFPTVVGSASARLARLHADGSLDPTFVASADSSVLVLTLQPDGKILIGGIFAVVNNTARNFIARLHPDGSLDTSFNPILTGSINSPQLRVDAIVVQSDAKILVGGTFNAVNGISRTGIARLNADGSLDPTFSTGSGSASVKTIVVQADGRILIGGAFGTFAGRSRRNIARLSSTGTPDNEVGVTGPNSAVQAIVAHSDGRFAVGGIFTLVGTLPRNNLARFNPDGSLDSTFDFAVTGANGPSLPGVYAMVSSASGQLVFAGTFSAVNGQARNGLARIAAPPPSIATPPRTQIIPTGQPIALSVTALGSSLSYQWQKNGTPIAGATSSSLSIPAAAAADAGSYTVTVTNASGTVTSAAAVVTVNPTSVYIVQAPGNRTVTAGSDVSLSVVAGGQPPVTYQWRKDGAMIAGATDATLTLGRAVPELAGSYTVVISDPSASITTTPAVLTVNGDVPFMFSTLAGEVRVPGTTDGTATAARFNQPSGVAVDGAGYIYVADNFGHTIRKVSPTGVVSTLAGQAGSAGSTDGAGPAARFAGPRHIALDREGNLYVADVGNTAIRKITPAGVVSTFAGQIRSPAIVDGVGPAARFASPTGIATDAAGNLYVTESTGHTIRKITPDGTVTTLAGVAGSPGSTDGSGAEARFNGPRGIAVDGAGTLYVADSGNHTIRQITSAGVVTTLAGQTGASGSADGRGGSARFTAPAAVAVDPWGNVFVATSTLIRKISPDGNVTTVGGATGPSGHADAIGTDARFNAVTGIACDHLGGLYISDTLNALLRRGIPIGRRGAQLANLSVRGLAGTEADTLIVGFSLTGGAKPMLVRAVGPTLEAHGVSGALADPSLRLDLGSSLVAQNDDWSSAGGDVIGSAAASVGAFPLPAQSRDAALLRSLESGTFTAQVGGGTGVALVEVYDTSTSGAASTLFGNAGPRLANVSTRTRAGTGAGTLIVGFVLAGDSAKTVLIRGIGPALSAFGVDGALTNPRLELYRETMLVADNSGWGGDTALSTAFTQVGAFPLSPDSADAALLVTLLPGAYTVQVVGSGGATGVALVEIYELP